MKPCDQPFILKYTTVQKFGVGKIKSLGSVRFFKCFGKKFFWEKTATKGNINTNQNNRFLF